MEEYDVYATTKKYKNEFKKLNKNNVVGALVFDFDQTLVKKHLFTTISKGYTQITERADKINFTILIKSIIQNNKIFYKDTSMESNMDIEGTLPRLPKGFMRGFRGKETKYTLDVLNLIEPTIKRFIIFVLNTLIIEMKKSEPEVEGFFESKEKEREVFFCDNGIKECIKYCKNKKILFAIATYGSRIVIEIILCYLLYCDGEETFKAYTIVDYENNITTDLIEKLYKMLLENQCMKEGIFITTTDDYKYTQETNINKHIGSGRFLVDGKLEGEAYTYARMIEKKEEKDTIVYNKNRQLDFICDSFLKSNKKKLIFFDDDIQGSYGVDAVDGDNQEKRLYKSIHNTSIHENDPNKNIIVGNVEAAKEGGYLSSLQINKIDAFKWEILNKHLNYNFDDFVDADFKNILVTMLADLDSVNNKPSVTGASPNSEWDEFGSDNEPNQLPPPPLILTMNEKTPADIIDEIKQTLDKLKLKIINSNNTRNTTGEA